MNQTLEINFPDMKFTFADFFCGCGGLSLGFIQAGLKCIAAMDRAEDALHNIKLQVEFIERNLEL